MAITGHLYDSFPAACMSKLVTDMSNLAATTIKVALCTSTYTPSQANHTTYNDITNEVASGGGYTTGGATLTLKTGLAYSLLTATRVTTFLAGDVAWANSSITARYAIIYDATPSTAVTKRLIGYLDFGQDYTTSVATFQIVWNSSGILSFTVT